ncbi:OsmC family protein [Ketogulonicigenium vulgare]|uniref:OsmC family protein n=1 Tax=Ketogulonicigenium vulgare (strain WSH-001) TaxID=759362 RepID=F9Y4Z2_KETVW|nr:OsmC family protein [Ketogulonicigenium vulgare]AEM40624.1 OsmC family protein [Ketogulonicigenium vulgare WSH-001]ALJ80799.1 osmotically inducible protein C [Ketogulonicigenium vulgare]ANW33581.1 osmotically inducible protein C [Ketogulonicigenium vulgare]AOZ54339.1 OsmC family protein [Ketogulonicigenium vulgare]
MEHSYSAEVIWTGNRGAGTINYRGYDRTWDIAVPGKAVVHCSNDPLLGGDPTKMNPEDLLLSSLSACHMLWYLHYAANAGLIVSSYRDSPIGVGEVEKSGAGRFLSATLRPEIALNAGADLDLAHDLHHRIHAVCFIARSVNFPISYAPTFRAT